jgi:thiopurine S-methyltransferase
MTAADWHDRWAKGRTGWHETEGNTGLKAHWRLDAGRVLVPLCGKTPDLVWLAERGHDVVGVELSDIAIRDFFAEQNLSSVEVHDSPLTAYRCRELPITLYHGDYFEFTAPPFDAVYDRGALVAIDPRLREKYVSHTKSLLAEGAAILLIALEYDQAVVAGPPFALMPDELDTYFGDLERVFEQDDIDNCPPKFREAGLTDICEVVWRSSG